MAKNCNCNGQSCGCRVEAGEGATVTGIGTAANPFVIALDLAAIEIGAKITVNDTTTVRLTMTGDGSTGNPVLLTAAVVLESPNGSEWTLAVSNAGVLSAVAL